MLCQVFLLVSLIQACRGLLEENFVAFNKTNGAVPIHDATIVYSGDDAPGVKIAVDSLAGDWEAITGRRPLAWQFGANETSGSSDNSPDSFDSHAIIAATLDTGLMNELVDRLSLNVSILEGKREAFTTSVVHNALPGVESALLIAGSDSRATAFGIYTLAEQSGQSPFHFWLDVSTKKHDEIYAIPTTTYSGEPAVKYRGLFINDEAPALTGWWSMKHGVDHYPLDSEFYRHVFDMLLRLKGNFMWPGMWASFVPRPGNMFFVDDPYNQKMADDYGITVSTSHHEPMQRASNEWTQSDGGIWDWTENKANVTDFMRHGAERAKGNDTFYTLGMRGPNDGAIQGDDPIGILRDVFETQHGILSDVYGNATEVKKVWTIYKEVGQYYAGGLIPEDDVTLMWTDDNWGNIMRLPLGNETARSGGVGLYYHLEYVGSPKSFKWHNTNNLPKIFKELSQAHERGVGEIFVINVADIKPVELPFGFIMDFAWSPSRINFDTIPYYLEQFAAREFGPQHSREIAEILFDFSRLVARRKFESVSPATYSVSNYRESERVLEEWGGLAMRTMEMSESLPEQDRAAFFHLATHPVLSGWNYHRIVLGQGQNYQYATERRNQANSVAQDVLEYFQEDYDYEEAYDTLLDGKWKGIMAQPKIDSDNYGTWKQTSRDVLMNISYVALRQNMVYQFGPLGIYAEGSENAANQGIICASLDESMPTEDPWSPVLPTLSRYGADSHFVEIFHRGDHRVPVNWTITNEHDWLNISHTSGQISKAHSQQRVDFSVDWRKIPSSFNDTVNVTIEWDALPRIDYIHVPVFAHEAPMDFEGFPEAAGITSIEAAHFQRKSSDSPVSFEKIPYLGTRTESGAVSLRPYKAARESAFNPDSAWVEYDIYLFEDAPSLNATVYITSGLDTDPIRPMEYSLRLDSEGGDYTRLLEDPATPGDLPPEWEAQVQDSVWTRTVELGGAKMGAHKLRWFSNSPEIYLEKIVVYGSEGVRESYLGPPETAQL